MNDTSQPLRFGLLGCGGIALRHAVWLRAEPDAAIALCCDPRREAAESLAAEFAPTAAIAIDWKSALAENPLDALIVCSPNSLHFPQVSAALSAGLHVLCEKPLATRRDEIERLIDHAGSSQRVLSIAHQRRYAAPYVTARRELDERAERYGPLRTIHVFYGERWQSGSRGTWRDDPDETAGFFADAGIHHIDVVRFVAGREIRRVWATSDRAGGRVEIVTQLAAELDGGIRLAAHWVGNAHHWREDIHFHCERAELLLRNQQLFIGEDNRCEVLTDLVPDDNPVAALVRAIRTGGRTVTPPEIALGVCDYVAAVTRSLREGGWVEVG